jgi:ABC-type sulfate transport system permease subunit
VRPHLALLSAIRGLLALLVGGDIHMAFGVPGIACVAAYGLMPFVGRNWLSVAVAAGWFAAMAAGLWFALAGGAA